MKSLPDFSFENKLWKKYKIIAGMDEVGRGALAGPVYTGLVIFQSNIDITDVLINDSKKLTQKQREKACIWIKENALSYGIGSASVTEINKHGIIKATNIAFRRAIKESSIKIDFLLMDAFYVPFLKGIRHKNQLPIIKGDAKSVSIAAASIIAKVERDKVMTNLSKNPKYKNYEWNHNKGYGTLKHREAIKIHGKTRLHRVSFLLKLS